MTEHAPTRLRLTGPIERPGPSIIIISGPDPEGRKRFRSTLDR